MLTVGASESHYQLANAGNSR